MKTRILSLLAVAVIAVASMTSCGKYEDGPGFSLRSKKARLTGEWKVTEFKQDGEDLSSEIEATMVFDKDNNYAVTAVVSGFTFSEVGTWEFDNKKEDLKLDPTVDSDGNDEPAYNITISRLTNKEFWYSETETEDGETTVTTLKLEKK